MRDVLVDARTRVSEWGNWRHAKAEKEEKKSIFLTLKLWEM